MKLSQLCVVIGILIVASFARADYNITSVPTLNAFTLDGQSFDTYQFFVTNTGTNGTGTGTNQIDLAIYDSTNGGKNGMLISASNAADGSDAKAQQVLHASNPVEGYPDVYGQLGEASLPQTSWLKNVDGQAVTVTSGSSVVTFASAFTKDQADGSGIFANSYSDLQLVSGCGADEFWNPPAAANLSAGAEFAQASVLHGDVVTLVVPVRYGRTIPSTTWDTGGTSFGIPGSPLTSGGVENATGTYSTSAVPEPAGVGLAGLAALALLKRRRNYGANIMKI